MAAVNPCAFLENAGATHHSEEMRRSYQDLLGTRYGVVNSGDLAVTANGTPNQTVIIAAGRAIIPGGSTVLQGDYHVTNDAAYTLSMPAADGSNPRKDLVIAQVVDDYYVGGSTHAWQITYVTGVASASPATPATPVNSIVLAVVARAAGSSGNQIATSNITDGRPQFTKHVGTWLTAGAPTSAVGYCWPGDYGFDVNGVLQICTAAGNPGTWIPTTEVRFNHQVFSSQASVTIPIPAGFSDIKIRWRAKSDQSSFQTLNARPNGVSSANYWDSRMEENGSSSSVYSNGAPSGATSAIFGYLGATGVNAGFTSFGDWELCDVNFPLAAGGVMYKFDYFRLDGGSTGQQVRVSGGGVLTSGAVITSLVITPAAGNIINGRFEAYGRAA